MILAAGTEFGNRIELGTVTFNKTGATVQQSVGEQRTRVLLLMDDELELCLISSDLPTIALPISDVIRREVGGILGIDPANVLNFCTHNHCTVTLMFDAFEPYLIDRWRAWKRTGEYKLTRLGRTFMRDLRVAVRSLRRTLEPVSVWWAVGREDRISYNRKGRRADGSTYLMREQDRVLVGKDFRGDIDTDAPVVSLKREDGSTVAAIVQFTSHPVTAYHPERPVAHGEYPQVACDVLADHLARDGAKPTVVFLQGCCGDVNSKQMFVGGPESAERHGRRLGRAYVKATRKLTPSRADGLDCAVEVARVPLAPLPSEKKLVAEVREMEDFIARAKAGDEDTLSCVGLNFPRRLSPAYRAKLVAEPLAWNRWALNLHRRGRADSVLRHLEMQVHVVRIGDVGIVGLPCEPFQGIGRQIRASAPVPLAIPTGYLNYSHGYVTDAPNTGDREYMSAFYRYSRFRPPYRRPAGDILAKTGVRMLRQMIRSAA